MGKKRAINIIASILVILGIAVLIYTFVSYKLSVKENEELIEMFDEIVKETNADEITSIASETEIDSSNEIADYSSNEITFEEFDATDDEVTMEESTEEIESEDVIPQEEEQEKEEPKNYDGYTIICKIEIPSIDLVDVVVEGESLKNLKIALGHFSETPLPGQGGNFAVCGHNGSKYGTYLTNLKNTSNGDLITITMIDGKKYTYQIYDSFVIEPTDFSILDQYDDGVERITLMTCTNYGKQRFVVRGELTVVE